MPNTKITKSRWETHFQYGKWIYIVLAILAICVSNLLFTSTEYRPPNSNKVTIQFVDHYAMVNDLTEDLAQTLLERVSPEDETLEAVELFSFTFTGQGADSHGFDKYYVELYVGENDMFITLEALARKIVNEGLALPLDEFVESGALTIPEGAEPLYMDEPIFDEDGNRVAFGEKHLYGFSTDPLVQLPRYAQMSHETGYAVMIHSCENPETTLRVVEELYAEMSKPMELVIVE
ncbi:MAG: hypothetical protein E7335_03175 [Clostridiales bacterium]|nr:hypothetical protein [Clostridiales bacterium]